MSTDDDRLGAVQRVEAYALAYEVVSVSHVVDRTIGLMRKVFDGAVLPTLDEVLDVDALREHIQHKGAHAYAEVYTEDELRDTLAFFNSPSGQTMIAKQPLVESRVESFMTQYMESIMQGRLDG